nr:VasL domain-containing protein [uncultured Moellerella sp.]
MSQQSDNLVIKVGESPLDLPEFMALKSEINKINHPARPDVSWPLVESLSLVLFKNNGIDLQSGVYYTIARLHIHGLSGFTEGCELLANVMVSQWNELWPVQPNYRTDILNWFNSRATNTLRQCAFNQTDLRLIYRAERALQLIIDQLAQTTWAKLPKLENLLWYFQNTAKNLEQREKETQKISSQVNIPPLVYIPQSANTNNRTAAVENKSTAQESADLISQYASEYLPQEVKKMSALSGYFLGLASGVFILAVIGMTVYYPMKKEQAAITATPEGAIAQWFYQPQLASYSNQLTLLEKQTPISTLKQADKMIATAQKLWPNNADQAYATRQWNNLIVTRLTDMPNDNSWFDTGAQIQQLADKIIEQERNRGSFTLSYLKTAIYDIQKSHNQNIPIEEQLREFAWQIEQGNSISPSLINKLDSQINGLVTRYYDLQKRAESSGLKPNSL